MFLNRADVFLLENNFRFILCAIVFEVFEFQVQYLIFKNRMEDQFVTQVTQIIFAIKLI